MLQINTESVSTILDSITCQDIFLVLDRHGEHTHRPYSVATLSHLYALIYSHNTGVSFCFKLCLIQHQCHSMR